MAELKTKATTKSAEEFLNLIEVEEKKKDSLVLLNMFKKITGESAVMWGESIVGFGKYHYKSERSTQEGDWPLVGFSPRKQNLALYVMAGNDKSDDLLKKLGKHTKSKGCLYIKKLSDIDQPVLIKIIETSFRFMKENNK